MELQPDRVAEGIAISGRMLNWPSGGLIVKPARIPMDRLTESSEIASAIEFIASTDASFITGRVRVVDGGQTAVEKFQLSRTEMAHEPFEAQ